MLQSLAVRALRLQELFLMPAPVLRSMNVPYLNALGSRRTESAFSALNLAPLLYEYVQRCYQGGGLNCVNPKSFLFMPIALRCSINLLMPALPAVRTHSYSRSPILSSSHYCHYILFTTMSFPCFADV